MGVVFALVGCALAEAEPGFYGGFGGLHYVGKRSADAEADAEPGFYGGYGGHRGYGGYYGGFRGLHCVGKRSADAEPGFYGGFGRYGGYGGYGGYYGGFRDCTTSARGLLRPRPMLNPATLA